MKRRVIAASPAILLFVGFGLGCCAYGQQSTSPGIVGRWFSQETSKGGIGAVFEFRADGSVDYSPGAVVKMPWRIEKNQLILPADTGGGSERNADLKWLGENKLRLETGAAAIDLERVGRRPDAGNPIVGEWIENREMAGSRTEVRYLFYARGELLLVVPFAIQHGSYGISGSVLQVNIQGRKPTDFEFKLAGDSLVLSSPNAGHEWHYSRY